MAWNTLTPRSSDMRLARAKPRLIGSPPPPLARPRPAAAAKQVVDPQLVPAALRLLNHGLHVRHIDVAHQGRRPPDGLIPQKTAVELELRPRSLQRVAGGAD